MARAGRHACRSERLSIHDAGPVFLIYLQWRVRREIPNDVQMFRTAGKGQGQSSGPSTVDLFTDQVVGSIKRGEQQVTDLQLNKEGL